MNRVVERLLNLQPGDLRRGGPLFLYLFLVISSYVVGKAARDALFLDRFSAIQLPYADIAIAVLVGLVAAAYVRIGHSVAFRSLLTGCLVFFALNAGAFWWCARFHRDAWIYPVLYVWVGIYGVLAPMQVWTLANYVLTMREAKRLFGLIGGGAIAGWIFGGFLTNQIVHWFSTEDLLLVIAVALALCALLVPRIWRQRAELSGPGAGGSAPEDEPAASVLQSLRTVSESAYLRAIAAVICLSSFVTTVAGWQFKAIAKQALHDKEALASFFGTFNLYGGLLALAVQLFFTSRFLRRFGIGPALFAVPAALTFTSAGILVWPTLLMAVALKGSDQVLRYSIDKSTVELLYLPVPARIKMQVKSFLDTFVWRMGDGLAGVVLLLCTAPLALAANPGRAAWVSLALLGGWVAAAAVARSRYVLSLSEGIRRHRLDAERASAPVLDRSTAEILGESLGSTQPGEILYALDLLGSGDVRAAHPAVRGLLEHPEPAIRRRAIEILDASGDPGAVPRIEELLRDSSQEVRTTALLFLAHHTHVDPLSRIQELGDFPDFSIRSGMIAFLANRREEGGLHAARVMLDAMVREQGEDARRVRVEAARLIAKLPDEFSAELRLLLDDPDAEVVREAVRSAGQVGDRALLRPLLDLLQSPGVATQAAEALSHYGARIVGTLSDNLGDERVPIAIRREIPGVLARIGGPAALCALGEHLLEGDTGLRFQVLSALNVLRRSHPEVVIDLQLVETVLAGEIVGHYRSYQILGALGVHLEQDPAAVAALRRSMDQEIERVFRLLSLLHPHHDFQSAHVGLRSTVPTVHDNALEFLENVLKPQVRELLVPLIDSNVSIAERVQRADKVVGVKLAGPERATAVLLSCGDPWLRSCGAFAVGLLGLRALEGKLDALLDDPDPLLREAARQAKASLDPSAGRLPPYPVI